MTVINTGEFCGCLIESFRLFRDFLLLGIARTDCVSCL